MNQLWRPIEKNEKKIVVIGLGHRDTSRDSKRCDDLRQGVGMPNHESVTLARPDFRDQRPEIIVCIRWCKSQ